MAEAALWRRDELGAALGAQIEGEAPQQFGGVSIDSRTVREGDIFFAIKGERLDGHDYVAAALAKGAGVAVVCADWPAPAKLDGALLRVGDVLAALEALGAAARARTEAKIVAVTGSVGKTSTKDMLACALGANGKTHAAVASFNNHWGVPLTLARMPRDTAYAVIEIGMNHPGEITPLSRLARPHVAVITTVEAAHLGQFASLEEIAQAKAEIFDGLIDAGAAVLNRDNRFFGLLRGKAEAAGAGQVIAFGEGEAAAVRLVRASHHDECSTAQALVAGEGVTYKIGTAGRHLVINSLAVLAVVHALGADLAKAAVALANWAPLPGRGVRKQFDTHGGPIVLIDESYNANPASMRAALETLGRAMPHGAGRRIAVLGDMLELGHKGPALHAALAGPIQDNGVDKVYMAGPLMGALRDALPAPVRGAYANTAAELTERVRRDIRPGDVVMVKGSLGSRMIPLVEALEAFLTARAESKTGKGVPEGQSSKGSVRPAGD